MVEPFPSMNTRVCREEVRLGQPGSPGGNDLTRALHRLTLRRQNFLCERQFFQAEREKKLQALADGEGSGCSSPTGSVLSSFSNLSELSFSSSVFKTFLPEKLQIVKPMEGRSLFIRCPQLLVRNTSCNLVVFPCLRLTDPPSLAAAGQATPSHHPGPPPRGGNQRLLPVASGRRLPPVRHGRR